MAMRRCPSPIRCRVAAWPPLQLVAPTNGTSSGRSSFGSKTTNGMPLAFSWARSFSDSCATDRTHCGRRSTVSSMVLFGVSWRPNSDTRTPILFLRATSSTPRMISTAHMLSSSRKTSSTSLLRFLGGLR